MAVKKLTPKQERFCQRYVIDLNGTQSAKDTGYGKTDESAAVQAARLLSNVKVKARIKKLMDKRAARVRVSADDVLIELLAIAKADITQAFDEMGHLKPLNEIPPEVRKCIKELEVQEIFTGDGDQKHAIGLNRKIKFHDKNKALEMLGRHLAMFTDRLKLEDAAKDLSDEELFRRAREVILVEPEQIEDMSDDEDS